MADPLRPTDPRSIGRYRTLRRLGAGGMGSVYLAEDPAGRLVAVKVIRPEYAHEPEYRARFRSEVNRAREVPPFCTAEVIDADPDHETPYLVVEYVDGPSLDEVVGDQGPLTGGSLHGVAVGVAAALAAIHGAGVVHRDLKPRNVLFALGTPKVIDFGIARPLDPTSFHTRADQVVGTLAYMAPERLDAETDRLPTPAVDVFAWGAVVTFAGTGRTPFGGDSPAVTAARILTQPPRVGDLPPYLAELVAAALEKEPENRPTAPELLDRLLVTGAPSAPPLPVELQRSAEAAQQSGRFDTGPRKRPARRRLAMVAAAAAVVSVAVAGGILLRPTSPEPEPPAAPQVVTGPAVFDALRTDSLFTAEKTQDGRCAYDDGLRVTANSGNTMMCGEYQRIVFPPSQNVSVRAVLGDRRSCAVIGFRAESDEFFPDAYQVTVCPARVGLAASLDGEASPIAGLERATTAGAEHLIQVVAGEREATVSIDGEVVLTGPLDETSLVSGRVLLGASGGSVTYTDAQLRSGADPATPRAPEFLTGDAELVAAMHMVYDKGRVAIAEPAEFPTGAEYCRRLALNSAKCDSKYVPVGSGLQASLPIAARPKYLDFRPDQRKCTDPATLAGTCQVSFSDFSTVYDEPSPFPALVTIRGGKVTAVARINLH
ncbi:serine/threonine-protein kinase [Actinoplanes sp. NPDC026670]|uniref:serine/threonine protein kinase n=1 Tax=Actinoplanes sp. NPDC026670 TaxID=3154700 RepID=UPI0033C9647E